MPYTHTHTHTEGETGTSAALSFDKGVMALASGSVDIALTLSTLPTNSEDDHLAYHSSMRFH